MPANRLFITPGALLACEPGKLSRQVVGKMRIVWTMAAAALGCALSLGGASGAEETLGLRGQIYFEPAAVAPPSRTIVPRHISAKHVARAPVDFSYPETAASTGSNVRPVSAGQPVEEGPWHLELSDGAKLRFAYDKDTHIKLGMGMWKVKVGVSKAFGGPNAGAWELPVRHSRAAALGRAGGTNTGHPLN